MLLLPQLWVWAHAIKAQHLPSVLQHQDNNVMAADLGLLHTHIKAFQV